MKKDSALKLDQQIRRIEETIDTLLAGIVISKLTVVQRLRFVTRFMGLYLRALVIRHKFERDDPGDRENPQIAELMRLMRGDPEATPVVDSELGTTEVTLQESGLDVSGDQSN
jgi:hypothetical protein